MIFLQERVGKLIQDLARLARPCEHAIGGYAMRRMDKRLVDPAALPADGWTPHKDGSLWGGHRERFLFRAKATVPPEFAGQCVTYSLITGREGNWDATNPQFSLYVDGRFVQGLDVNHTEAILTESAKGGESFDILLSAFTGDQNYSLVLDSRLRVLDRDVEKYYFDLKMPFDVAALLEPDSEECIGIVS
jgi:alpha-mannosidase